MASPTLSTSGTQATDHPQATAGGVAQTTNRTTTVWGRRVLALVRILFGFTFLWAFADKTFGLGFSTPTERAWINGGDPTAGFLSNNEGTFASTFQSLAGQWWVSPLFMVGLLGIGIALLAGAGLRIAAATGALLYLGMYLAAMPLTTNPIVDSHLTGAVILVMLALLYAGDTWGLGTWWRDTSIVRRFPFLR